MQRDPVYRRIAAHLERLIRSGELGLDERIPPTAELAGRFGVTVDTMQHGLSILARRGILLRRRKTGTFVNPAVMSACVGIVIRHEVLADPDQKFYSALLASLLREIKARKWEAKTYLVTEVSSLVSELEQDISTGKLKALVNMGAPKEVTDMLQREGGDLPFIRVPADPDFHHFTITGVDYLLSCGYKHIDIMSCYPSPSHFKGSEEALRKHLGNEGMKRVTFNPCAQGAVAGREAIHELYSKRRRRPEALLVVNDGACRGVIFGLLELGVRIPQDVALLTHANKGLDIMSPVSLTMLEFEPEGFAKDIISRIDASLDLGELPPPLYRTARLVVGLSCGEGEGA